MMDFSQIETQLRNGEISPTKAIQISSSMEPDVKWKIGSLIYELFDKDELDSTVYTYASRAFYKNQAITVVADSTPEDYWGIYRNAMSSIWRPFRKGVISSFYFINDKVSGIGWKFAIKEWETRLSFMASCIMDGVSFYYVWEFNEAKKFSPILQLSSLTGWFDEHRIGCYIIEPVNKIPMNAKLTKRLSFNKQHKFKGGCVDIYVYKTRFGKQFYASVKEDSTFWNVYMDYGVNLPNGNYKLKPLHMIYTNKSKSNRQS